MNGVPAYPGPCPNERLGIVDLVVYGTSHSVERPERYGGGALFRDLVEGREVHVKVESAEGKVIERYIKLKDMSYAKMLTTRSTFKNYMAFTNPCEDSVKTIFSIVDLKGPFRMATFSGCGELNPLEKDPLLRTIGVGSKVLVNDAIGYVVSTGTRSTREKPNLSIYADMMNMKPEFMGQFITSAGPEAYISIAIPIPIIDEEVLRYAAKLDEEIPLPIADVHDRRVLGYARYADVWQGVDLEVKHNAEICRECSAIICPVLDKCPTGAFDRKERRVIGSKCFDCGACTWLCPRGAFKANLGKIRLGDKVIPVALRQSSRRRAEELAFHLKKLIEKGEFTLREPVDKIVI